MWRLLQTTLGEAERLINFLKSQLLINGSKIGLAGASFGAVLTYHYLVWGKEKVQAASFMSGIPDLVSLLQQPLGFLTPNQGSGLEAFVPPDADSRTQALAWAENFSALNHWQVLAEMPLLMLHGSDDETVSPAGEARLYDLLAETNPDQNVVYQYYEQVGHEGNNVMRDALVNWFSNTLILEKMERRQENGR